MADLGRVRIQRLSTGDAELDGILGGGFPLQSVNIVAGGPGTGKSILTLQTLFYHARRGKKVLYFTTVSEPAIKLIRYMQQFDFFDADLVDERVFFYDLGSPARSEGLDRALDVCIEQIEERQPNLVAFDSFKALHDLARDPELSRAFVYDLAVNLATYQTTSFLVGEYYEEDIRRYPEFFIADGIVYLALERENLRASRQIEVLKLRGASPVQGRHFFDITASGIVVHPRVRAPEDQDEEDETEEVARLAVGIPGLDEMMDGGVPARSATLVEGGTGTGKTLISLSFLMEGARNGEPGVLFTMEESRPQVLRMAAGRGWNLRELERQGLMRVVYTSPIELAGDALLQEARRVIAELGAKRAVIDSLSSLKLSIGSEGRFKELVFALVKTFRSEGLTLFLTNEVPELLGSVAITGHGVSSIADNVVLLRYVEVGADLKRALSVLKMRGSAHQMQLRELLISATEIKVDGPFKDLQGVLTGVPVQTKD
ncbi:MAG TPA: ATPase domain-containing protein [Chloroflexota bacterium]|nr:ATPase domain-containing protein [Chloroflexota bacterium]